MPENNITLDGARKMLLDSPRTLIYTHGHPDADTLGSALALKLALKKAGCEAYVTCLDPIPARLAFLADEPMPEGFEPDLVCAVDVASYMMLGIKDDSLRGRIDLKIDHHRIGEDYAKFNYTDEASAACGEIIFDLLGGDIDGEIAAPLYAAVASDTGCFRFSNTTARTHVIAARLTEYGVDTARLNHLLFESRSVGEIAALRLALESLEYHCGGRLAIVCFTNEDKKKYGFDDDCISAHNSLTREIEGVELGITLRQKSNDPDAWKISMRSGESVDVSALCGVFGGGGHIRAAGCEITAPDAKTARETILHEAVKAFENE
ncbi:MAG: DHH family phosphoesterase [Clostridia bacterium]|nr:DHH family phosphoesterase [Clostridia bacterium]